MKVSVIIVAYKNGYILQESLNSINRFNDIGSELEIIVVDNSPYGEEIQKYVIESDCKNTKYIRGKNNGFGAGNNIGAKVASGEILAFINPDVYLVEPIFYEIYERFMSNEKLMILGCQVLNTHYRKVYSFFYDYEHSFVQRFLTKIYNHLGIYNQRKMFMSGCNMFIRKTAFLEVGGFDENIFMYNEEADIKKRITKSYPESKVEFCKEHSIIHIGGSAVFSEERFVILKNSLIYFGKKYNLNYKKKLKYDYNVCRLKYCLLKAVNSDKRADVEKEIKCFEKHYKNYIKESKR